ncbi:uncharacterized protein TrAtP1_000535 [Trichoderma atroviride]|uniref:uncharacterized protein n=1 Tax=Hypocrea atroviridis TaxID=63577 RepID=UPI00332A00B5|nr:hypothetical protein TrAtP1_000535 [Trichoderma atroviride]
MKRFYLLHHLDYVQIPTGEDEQVFVNSILGRVVLDYREPGRNYVTITRTPETAAVLASNSHAFDQLREAVSKSKSLKLKLTVQKILGFEEEATKAGDRQVKAATVTYHFFVSDDAIDQVRRDARVKEKLQTWLARGGSRVWLITGFIMARTADTSDGVQATHASKASVDPAAALQDVSVNVEASRESKQGQHGDAKLSKLSVVAVRYMCLQRPYLSRGPAVTTKLKSGPADFSAEKPDPKSDDWVADVVDGSITDILKDSDELDHEDFGDVSFAFDADDDEDYDEVDEDEDEDEDETFD